MTSIEIVVIERMNECSTNSGKESFIERFPSNFVRDWNEYRPERFHSFQLRLRRGFNDTDHARHACRPRRMSNALAGVARTDCPDAAFAISFGQCRDGIGCAAQLVGVDRLQVLQLQTDVGKLRSEFEANQRRT